MHLTKASFAKMDQAIIVDMLCSKNISTATLFQTIVEDIKLHICTMFFDEGD